TLDGYYTSKSNYVLLELDDTEDTSASFPAGFTGVPTRVYGSPTIAPSIGYNTKYDQYSKIRKIYLGLSNTVGIDQNFFNFLGVDPIVTSGVTKGFHMDSGATANMLTGYDFEVGQHQFKEDGDLVNTTYEYLYSRKFTM